MGKLHLTDVAALCEKEATFYFGVPGDDQDKLPGKGAEDMAKLKRLEVERLLKKGATIKISAHDYHFAELESFAEIAKANGGDHH